MTYFAIVEPSGGSTQIDLPYRFHSSGKSNRWGLPIEARVPGADPQSNAAKQIHAHGKEDERVHERALTEGMVDEEPTQLCWEQVLCAVGETEPGHRHGDPDGRVPDAGVTDRGRLGPAAAGRSKPTRTPGGLIADRDHEW